MLTLNHTPRCFRLWVYRFASMITMLRLQIQAVYGIPGIIKAETFLLGSAHQSLIRKHQTGLRQTGLIWQFLLQIHDLGRHRHSQVIFGQ